MTDYPKPIVNTLSDRLIDGDLDALDEPVAVVENPLMQYAGMFENDPQFEEVLEEIATYCWELYSKQQFQIQ